MHHRFLVFIIAIALPGVALAQSVSPANSLAKYRSAPPPIALTFRSGYMAKPSGTKIVFAKVPAGMTVASIEASADDFECNGMAFVTLYDCGTSHDCAGAKVVGSVSVTSANALAQKAITGAIGMGDYYAWSIAGNCTGIDVTAIARAKAAN